MDINSSKEENTMNLSVRIPIPSINMTLSKKKSYSKKEMFSTIMFHNQISTGIMKRFKTGNKILNIRIRLCFGRVWKMKTEVRKVFTLILFAK
jgi:hypothetical protein